MPGIEEFLAEVESETTIATSLRLGEVGSEPASEVAAIVALEEEEENLDTHFKRKCRSPPPSASPRQKKKTARPSSRHRGTLQINEAEASAAYVPPLALLVTKPAIGQENLYWL